MIAEQDIQALNAWLAKAGLRGEPEEALVSAFCERAVAAGLPIGRAQVFIDTLHPVYEGRLVRWGHDPSRPVVHGIRPHRLARRRRGPACLVRRRRRSAMVARWQRKSVLPHVADRGELAAPARDGAKRARVSHPAGLPCGGQTDVSL